MQEYRTRLSEHELEVQRIRDRVQYQESRKTETFSVRESNFDNITHNDLIRIEKEWQEDDSKCNVSKNLQDAILCYYLNSGYARFNENLSYSKEYHSKLIDIEVIMEELENEMLSDKERYDRIEAYFNAHNFNAQLLSCGACGICNFESDNDTATIEYVKVSLESLPNVYKMTRS